jgi:TonB family protein
MKAFIPLLLLVLSYSTSRGNDTLYSYSTYRYDSSIKYVRKMVLTKDSGWLSLTYNAKNVLVIRAYYDDTSRKNPLYCHYWYKEETGILKGVGCFKNGKRDGRNAGFNEKGDTLWTTTFSDGRYVSQKTFPGYDPDADADPYFPRKSGGQETWQKFLNKNLRYPQKAIDAGAQGTVIISFIVSEDGKLSDFRVEHSVHPSIDEEASRVIKLGPEWIPATRDGKKVSMRADQPMVFRLE